MKLIFRAPVSVMNLWKLVVGHVKSVVKARSRAWGIEFDEVDHQGAGVGHEPVEVGRESQKSVVGDWI